MSSSRSIRGGFFWLTGQAIGRQLLLFGLFVALGRLLDPVDVGNFAIASSIVMLLQSISSSAISAAVIQKGDLNETQATTAYTLNLTIAVILAVTIAIAAMSYGYFRPVEWPLPFIVAILAATMPVAALSDIHVAMFAREFRFDLIAKKSIVGQISGGVVALALAISGFGVWSLVAQVWIASLTELAIVRYYSVWTAAVRLDRVVLSDLIGSAAPLAAARGIVAVDIRAPDFLLGGFAGPTSVGHFRLARSMFDVVVALAGSALKQIALPTLALIGHNPPLLRQRYLAMSAANAWLFFAPLAVLFVWGRELTIIIFGERWADSGWIVQLFAVQGIAYALFFLYEPLLISAGRAGDLLRLRTVQAGLSIAFMALAIPFGAWGMVAGNAVGVLLSIPFMYHFVAKATGLDLKAFVRAHAAPTAAATVVLAILAVARAATQDGVALSAICISIALASVVYALFFMWFGDRDATHALKSFMTGGTGLAARSQN